MNVCDKVWGIIPWGEKNRNWFFQHSNNYIILNDKFSCPKSISVSWKFTLIEAQLVEK